MRRGSSTELWLYRCSCGQDERERPGAQRRARSVCARACLRRAIRDSDDDPGMPSPRFSVSYSLDWSAVALGWAGELGVDLELVSAGALRAARRWCPDGGSVMSESDATVRWTLLEAAWKARPMGETPLGASLETDLQLWSGSFYWEDRRFVLGLATTPVISLSVHRGGCIIDAGQPSTYPPDPVMVLFSGRKKP